MTARFNYELMALCLTKKDDFDLLEVMQCMPTFDCRVGTYDTKDQALSLIFWRAYDCGINAVSDAVYKSGIPGSKQLMKKSTQEKLPWLLKQGMLPLPDHQRDGTFLVKRKRVETGVDGKTGEPVTYRRGRIEGNVLHRYKDGTLFPADDTLIS